MAHILLRESETRKLYEHWAGVPSFILDERDLKDESLYVVKVDETISGRYKKGLIKVGIRKEEVLDFLKKYKGTYAHVIIEPYIRITQEWYVSFETYPDYDLVRYSNKGGVDIEAHWSSVQEMRINLLDSLDTIPFPDEHIRHFYMFFREKHFAFLEVNPYGISGNQVYALDFKARIDDCAYQHTAASDDVTSTEEKVIASLDATTSASLKFRLLNNHGRIWPLVAGGGASIVYFDLINSIFGKDAIAFYGEYSGNPSTELLSAYTSTILSLVVKSKAKNKVLLIGGGNANFTYIPETFKGIIRALEEYAVPLQKDDVVVIVRRAGPHDTRGLRMMREFLERINLTHYVYGVETPIEETFTQYCNTHTS